MSDESFCLNRPTEGRSCGSIVGPVDALPRLAARTQSPSPNSALQRRRVRWRNRFGLAALVNELEPSKVPDDTAACAKFKPSQTFQKPRERLGSSRRELRPRLRLGSSPGHLQQLRAEGTGERSPALGGWGRRSLPCWELFTLSLTGCPRPVPHRRGSAPGPGMHVRVPRQFLVWGGFSLVTGQVGGDAHRRCQAPEAHVHREPCSLGGELVLASLFAARRS